MSTVISETLYHRLVEIEGLKRCQDVGCRKSGLPPTLHDDGRQEMSIALWSKEVDSEWDNGQCMSYAMTICKRVGVNLRRRMSQQMTIPQDVFQAYDVSAYQTKVDVSDELTEKTMASFGIMSRDDDDKAERSGLAILESLPASVRDTVDAALKTLPRSLIEMMYFVVVLNETVAGAADRMGIDQATGEKYVNRIITAIAEHNSATDVDDDDPDEVSA